MDLIQKVMGWLSGSNGVILFAVLFGISEALAQIPAIKANSIYQLVVKVLGWVKNLVGPKSSA